MSGLGSKVKDKVAKAAGKLEDAYIHATMGSDNPVDEYVKKGGDVYIGGPKEGQPVPHGPGEQQQAQAPAQGQFIAAPTTTAGTGTQLGAQRAEGGSTPATIAGAEAAGGYDSDVDRSGSSGVDVLVEESGRLDPGTGKVVDREVHTRPATSPEG